MRYALLAFLLLAGNAGASGLDDLRTALASLAGTGSLRGTLQVQTEHSDNYGNVPSKSMECAAASVEDDENGLRLAWDRSMLQRPEERNESTGEQGVANAVDTASATRISRSLHFAPLLLNMLKDAVLKSERTTTAEGKPGRELMLELPMSKLPEGFESGNAMQVWIDADGIPTAAMQGLRVLHRQDGVVTADSVVKWQLSFAHIGSRLVLVREDEEHIFENSGLGKRYEDRRHDIFTFTPQP
jgi:hypothetical protein